MTANCPWPSGAIPWILDEKGVKDTKDFETPFSIHHIHPSIYPSLSPSISWFEVSFFLPPAISHHRAPHVTSPTLNWCRTSADWRSPEVRSNAIFTQEPHDMANLSFNTTWFEVPLFSQPVNKVWIKSSPGALSRFIQKKTCARFCQLFFAERLIIRNPSEAPLRSRWSWDKGHLSLQFTRCIYCYTYTKCMIL